MNKVLTKWILIVEWIYRNAHSRRDSYLQAHTSSHYRSEEQDTSSEEEEEEGETGVAESSGEEEDDSGGAEVSGEEEEEEEEEEEHHIGTSRTRGRKRAKPAPTAPFKPGNRIDPLLTGAVAGGPEIPEILLSFPTHTAYNVYQGIVSD